MQKKCQLSFLTCKANDLAGGDDSMKTEILKIIFSYLIDVLDIIENISNVYKFVEMIIKLIKITNEYFKKKSNNK